jgi:hypothetical protein
MTASRTPARRQSPSYDRLPMTDRFPKNRPDRRSAAAPAKFEPKDVLQRTGFRLADEGRAAHGDLKGIGDGLARIGAGDFTSDAGGLIITVLGALFGLILLDLLLSPRGSTITSKVISWSGGVLQRVVSPVDPLTSPGQGTLVVSSPSTATPAAPAVPAGAGAGAGGYYDPVPGATFRRVDQGVDLQGKPGQAVRAIGDAQIDAVKSDPGGFGTVVYYTLLNGAHAGQQFYVGHAAALVKPGDQVAGGAAIARLLASPLGNATQPGWTEIGFAKGGAPAPKAGSAFKAFLDALLGVPNTKTSTNTTGGTTTVTGP